MTSFRTLRALSFTHSAIYTGLLVCWLGLGSPEPETAIFGWSHGVAWIGMSVLVLIAVRRRTIPFWLAVLVAVVGGLGPFVGTAGFLVASGRAPSAKPVV